MISTKHRLVAIVVILAAISAVCICIPAYGTDELPAPGFNYTPGPGEASESYPGWTPSGESLHVYGDQYIRWGLSCYYTLRGHWPTSWKDVVDEGIIQTPIYGLTNEVIDPDDPSLDFLGDVYYDSSMVSQDDKALVVTLKSNEGFFISYMRLTPPQPYTERFRRMDNDMMDGGADIGPAPFSHFLEDDLQMRRFVILSMIDKCLHFYDRVYGDYPDTWTDFVQSGLSPVDESSVNPLTGDKFYADGRPNDILYCYTPADRPADHPCPDFRLHYVGIPMLLHVDEEGNLPTYGFSY